ncbi:MAG TPA: hypothetical protein VH394_08375 [Thermoanaerobaculia bacterium]|jgi:hypothetical protein|nr:hypothetical protein [Thermoanaerobaculia bacterium]
MRKAFGIAGMAGIALLLLARTAGAQTIEGILISPLHPTTRDRIELTVFGTQSPGCPFGWQAPKLDKAYPLFILTAVLPPELPVCGSPSTPFRRTFLLDPLAAGTYYAQVRLSGLPYGQSYEVFQVAEPSGLLSLGENDLFRVNVSWRNPKDGTAGAGFAQRLADDSGAFWFFSPENVEVTIKILDGRPVNGKWWVFIASMTDLEMDVTVLENRNDCLSLPSVPPSCPTKVYSQAAGKNRNFIDVNAFAAFGD